MRKYHFRDGNPDGCQSSIQPIVQTNVACFMLRHSFFLGCAIVLLHIPAQPSAAAGKKPGRSEPRSSVACGQNRNGDSAPAVDKNHLADAIHKVSLLVWHVAANEEASGVVICGKASKCAISSESAVWHNGRRRSAATAMATGMLETRSPDAARRRLGPTHCCRGFECWRTCPQMPPNCLRLAC
jgi:hypothetical protein